MKPKTALTILHLIIGIIGLINSADAHYNPDTGSWPSRDPIQEKGGLRLYGFLNNDAVNYTDRFGLEFYAAFIPAWWELNDGNSEGFPNVLPGQGSVRDDTTVELFLRQGQRIAAESKKAAQGYIQQLRAMSDKEWERLTSNGFTVKWAKSFKEVGITPENLTGQEYDFDLIDRTGTSRGEVIRWLQHELGSYSEIFITGAPDAILGRVVQRANEELSQHYEWTSFALTVHNGPSGLNFPTGGVDMGKGRKAVDLVKARQKALIACGANPQGVGELVGFVTLDLEIDAEKCEAVFTPAQVVRGFSRD